MEFDKLDRLKWRTRKRSERLVEKGLLRSPGYCEKCGIVPQIIMRTNGRPQSWLEMHHPDYSDETLIVWLCKECHLANHGKKLRIPRPPKKPRVVQPVLWAHNAYGGKGHKNWPLDENQK